MAPTMHKNLLVKTKLLFGLALLCMVGGAFGQNRILDSNDQFFSITNFGPGPATMSNLTGLPLGTYPEADASGELALKVLVVNLPTTSGTAVAVTGPQEAVAATRATTSGNVSAGYRSVLFICSKAAPVVGNGTDFSGSVVGISRQPGDSFTVRAAGNDSLGSISYTISGGGSLDIITTK